MKRYETLMTLFKNRLQRKEIDPEFWQTLVIKLYHKHADHPEIGQLKDVIKKLSPGKKKKSLSYSNAFQALESLPRDEHLKEQKQLCDEILNLKPSKTKRNTLYTALQYIDNPELRWRLIEASIELSEKHHQTLIPALSEHLPANITPAQLNQLWQIFDQYEGVYRLYRLNCLSNLALKYPIKQQKNLFDTLIEEFALDFTVDYHGEMPFEIILPHLNKDQTLRAIEITLIQNDENLDFIPSYTLHQLILHRHKLNEHTDHLLNHINQIPLPVYRLKTLGELVCSETDLNNKNLFMDQLLLLLTDHLGQENLLYSLDDELFELIMKAISTFIDQNTQKKYGEQILNLLNNQQNHNNLQQFWPIFARPLAQSALLEPFYHLIVSAPDISYQDRIETLQLMINQKLLIKDVTESEMIEIIINSLEKLNDDEEDFDDEIIDYLREMEQWHLGDDHQKRLLAIIQKLFNNIDNGADYLPGHYLEDLSSIMIHLGEIKTIRAILDLITGDFLGV